MAKDITVDYEALQRAATELKSGREELEKQLKELSAMVERLTSTAFKTTRASGAFGEHHKRWNQSTGELIRSLDDISRAVQDVQRKHEQADNALAEGGPWRGPEGKYRYPGKYDPADPPNDPEEVEAFMKWRDLQSPQEIGSSPIGGEKPKAARVADVIAEILSGNVDPNVDLDG
jgi:WXG100 family type VII secretion target